MSNTERPTRLFDIVEIRNNRKRKRPCFRYADYELSAEEYIEKATLLSKAMVADGLRRGEAVAIIADNRPEWNIIDIGVLQAGAVLLPLCKGLSAEEYIECMREAKIRFMFVENEETLKRFRILLPQVETIEEVLLIEKGTTCRCLDDILSKGRTENDMGDVERRRSMVTTDDICTLIYSGGGTYSRITHRMLLQDIMQIATEEANRHSNSVGVGALCTRYGRTRNYVCQLTGRTVNYPSH